MCGGIGWEYKIGEFLNNLYSCESECEEWKCTGE